MQGLSNRISNALLETQQLDKGSKVQIENYRPIANLCSASKVFEKLILNQIQYLENKNKLDLTGKQKHGFKRKKNF